MSKVLRVSDGNYKIIVDNPSDVNGGIITLDTTGGYTSDRGKVVITGDLEVKGITTTVESTVTTIADNILTLNSGQQGAGVSPSLNFHAGIEIDRGSFPNALVLFDETVPYVTGGSSGIGSFVFENETGQLLPVSFNSLNAQGTLYITTPNSAINVAGTVNYEENVFTYVNGSIVDSGSGIVINNDHIPNTKAVFDFVNYAFDTIFQVAIEEGDTRLETSDFDISGLESTISATVDGVLIANFYSNRIELSDIKIQNNEISTVNSNQELILSSPGTGSVKIKDILEIVETPTDDDVSINPSAPQEGIKIYSKSEAEGGTGLYFVNKNNTQDEIISRNRSLLFSMLF